MGWLVGFRQQSCVELAFVPVTRSALPRRFLPQLLSQASRSQYLQTYRQKILNGHCSSWKSSPPPYGCLAQDAPATKRHSMDTAAGLGSSPTAPQTSLEGLPVELQGLIISKASGLQSLSALVHASPTLHHVYSGERLPILRFVLGNTLKGMLVDALGAHQSGTDLFQKTRERPCCGLLLRSTK